MLPNFLGIGTQRAATTWLFNCLREHPEVFVPQVKEVSFFNIHYPKGLGYYSSFFLDAQGHKAIGEISPAYLYSKNCAKRIAKHLPDVKMVVILRNPIDRAHSAYQYFIKPKTAWSFEETIRRDPSPLNKGLYFEQLQEFFFYYDRDQFLILLYDDLMIDNFSTLKSNYEFLEVNNKFRPSWLGKTVNTATFPKLRRFCEKLHLEWTIIQIKKTGLDSIIRKHQKKEKENIKPPIEPDTRLKLIEFFREPNERLGQLIGRDLSAWNQ